MTTETTIFLHAFNLRKDLPPLLELKRTPVGKALYGDMINLVGRRTSDEAASALGTQAGATWAALNAAARKSGGTMVSKVPELHHSGSTMRWSMEAEIVESALTES